MEKTLNTSSQLFEYLLRLADDRLILGHRLSEWCGHGPLLEEDIALANISLDCIGQAQFLYDAAAGVEGKKRTADELVYFREATEYHNLLLVEQPNNDFAHTIVRQFFYDSFAVLLFDALQQSTYAPLSGIAQKAIKELQYHYRHSSQWMIRLGDGTEESHQRMQTAVEVLYPYTGEMFESDEVEKTLYETKISVLASSAKEQWMANVEKLLVTATLKMPATQIFQQSGGRRGFHTEHLGHLLAEMQIVARSFPEMRW